MAGSDEGAGPVPYAELIVLDPLLEEHHQWFEPSPRATLGDAWGRSSG